MKTQLQGWQKQQREILDSIPLIAFVLDFDMKVKYVNQPAAVYFGHEIKYGLGLSLLEINPDYRGAKFYTTICMSMNDRVSTYIESHIIDHHERPLWIQQFTQPIEEGLLVFIQDITDSKIAHEKLDTLKKDLKESVEAHHAKIIKINRQLGEEVVRRQKIEKDLEEEMNRRQFFTHSLVHELKTPLTPILSSSETLISLAQEEPTLSLSKNIFSGASDLADRIDELLDIAKGEVRKLNLNASWVSPLELTQIASKTIAPLFTSSEQNLKIIFSGEQIQIPGDKTRLIQVITNLLKNASEYSPEGSEIILNSSIGEDKWVVSVEDNGSGILNKDKKNLFKMYSSIGSNGRRGLGIGLALSKMLVELHGGTIWYKNKRSGSIFGFTIPFHKKRYIESFS